MTRIGRREFLGRAVAASAAAAGAPITLAFAPLGETTGNRIVPSGIDPVEIGGVSSRMTRLGVGTGTIGWSRRSNQTRMDPDEFTRMIRHAVDRGITFFDSADMYGSHSCLRRALQGVPRDRFFLQSKVINRDPAQVEDDIDRIRRELDTDFIDSLLMHVVTGKRWDDEHRRVMEVLSRSKERGRIGSHGCSCHGIEPLRTAAATPWVEIGMARINHRGSHMDAATEDVTPVLREMRERGAVVVGMKVLGQGDLAADEEKDRSLRFVLRSGAVDAIVIGFESSGQIDDMITRVDRALNEP